MPVKSNLKDKLEDDVLDLSLMQLDSIPVKDIAPLTKGTTLDLSNNLLTYVPESFSTLTHLVKLDLSKNAITELPEYFGNLQSLRHLDLYSNQLERLPVSFSQLKNLKWLDLKNNPLVPALRQAAGPCISNSDCTICAKKVVALLQSLQTQLENEKKLWILEEKRIQQEIEDAEKERIKADKKATAAKRRKEHKENGGKKSKAKSGGPFSDDQEAPVLQEVRAQEKSVSEEDSMREPPRNFFRTLFRTLLFSFFALSVVGASALWFYTEGNLNSKSIQRAIPLIRRDAESAYRLALNKVSTSSQNTWPWISQTTESLREKSQDAWKEFLRRNDVLAQYVNKHYGPYFCSLKKSFFHNWRALMDWGSNTLTPLLRDAQTAVWPYVGQAVDFVVDKSISLGAYISGALK